MNRPLHVMMSVDEPYLYTPADYFARESWATIFGREGVVEVDLGCGDGSFLIARAQREPERLFLGVERLLGRARKVARRARREGLDNVRVLRLESRYTVEYLLPPQSVHCLHLLFPDPWPKRRHHRRRLVSVDFLESVHQLLAPEGRFFFKTDHSEYFQWVCEAMELCVARGLYCEKQWPRNFFYPQTDFEHDFMAQGKLIHRVCFVKR